MTESEARLSLAADIVELRKVAADRKWVIIDHDDVLVVVDITSKIDLARYRLRFQCLGYPDHPPSVLPIDPASGRSDLIGAWPSCVGFRPMGDICMPITSEGFGLHPEWMNDPALRWISTGNPILRALEELQGQINDPAKYHGRAS